MKRTKMVLLPIMQCCYIAAAAAVDGDDDDNEAAASAVNNVDIDDDNDDDATMPCLWINKVVQCSVFSVLLLLFFSPIV
jgi:hypothetical protein